MHDKRMSIASVIPPICVAPESRCEGKLVPSNKISVNRSALSQDTFEIHVGLLGTVYVCPLDRKNAQAWVMHSEDLGIIRQKLSATVGDSNAAIDEALHVLKARAKYALSLIEEFKR